MIGTVNTKIKGLGINIQGSHQGWERQIKDPSSVNIEHLTTRHLGDLVPPPLFPKSRNGSPERLTNLPRVTQLVIGRYFISMAIY